MTAACLITPSPTTYETVQVFGSKKGWMVVMLAMEPYKSAYRYINTDVKLQSKPMASNSFIIALEALLGAVGEAVAALKVLANEDRLLLCQLSQGEWNEKPWTPICWPKRSKPHSSGAACPCPM